MTQQLVNGFIEYFNDAHILLDDEHRIVKCNKAAMELLNCNVQSLIGSRVETLLLPLFGDENRMARFLSGDSEGSTEIIGPVENDGGNSSSMLLATNTILTGKERMKTGSILGLLDISKFVESENYLKEIIDEVSMLNRVYRNLHAAEKASDIITTTLIAVTAGMGFRYNRAFLFLVDTESNQLEGKMAVGPSNAREAGRIWDEIDRSDFSLDQLFQLGRQPEFIRANTSLTSVCRNIKIPLDNSDHFLIGCMKNAHPCSLTYFDEHPGLSEFLKILGTDSIAVAPLHGRFQILGVLIADNAFSKQPIRKKRLDALQSLANQASIAIENMFLYIDLQQKMVELNKTVETLKKNQDHLVSLERLAAIGEVTSRLAHEIRNPLASIGGFIHRLKERFKPDAESRKYLDIISEETKRLENILNNVLTVARTEDHPSEKANMNDIIEGILYLFSKKMEDSNIELRVDLDEAVDDLEMSDYELSQVVMNLIKNALEAMPHGGTLNITSELTEDEIILSVKDTGIGIDESEMDNIFKPYFSTKTAGSGLGLSICHKIITRQGGEIKARSLKRQGSEFKISLPRNLIISGKESKT